MGEEKRPYTRSGLVPERDFVFPPSRDPDHTTTHLHSHKQNWAINDLNMGTQTDCLANKRRCDQMAEELFDADFAST